MDTVDVLQQAMVDKVAALERQVATLQEELERNRSATLGAMLGPLRVRQVVLLHVGIESPAQLVDKLSQSFGSWAANQAIRHMFDLNDAPCSDEQREQFRAMFGNGMVKF